MRHTILLFTVSSILLILSLSVSAQDAFFESGTSIGGYGELHYNADLTAPKRTLDFHRFVLFYGYDWTPVWSFNAEVELEHNYVKNGQGEVELEQAHIDFHPLSYFGFRAGVVLAPVGILNLTHEPPTFFSVERPVYSNVIIPTTWFGNGISFYGSYRSFSYNLTVMEGLNADGFSAGSGIRGGRMKGYKSDADHPLTALRVDYHGISFASLGFSYSRNKAVRADADPVALSLLEFHGRATFNNIIGSFEIGQITFDDYAIKNALGYYFEIGYNVAALTDWSTEVIPWFHWTDYNTANDTQTGGDSEKEHHYSKWMVGVSVKPIDQIAFKIDYGILTHQFDDSQTKQLNIGAGYMF